MTTEIPPPKNSSTESAEPSSYDVMLGAFSALGFALSARLILLLTLLGAFALAVLTIRSQTYFSLAALGLYCLFSVVPVAYLELHKGRT